MKKVIIAGLLVYLVMYAPAIRDALGEEPTARTRTWSVNIGPNAKNWGYAGVTKDFLLNDHLALFVTGGLGTFLVGGGAAFYTNSYSENSFVLSSTVGIIGADLNVCYQLKTWDIGYLTAGVSYGEYFMQYRGFLPVLSYEMRF